jgi:decaprenylphospho-beta-D-erythro-pentofuranosid-2-ulose 2-reductase
MLNSFASYQRVVVFGGKSDLANSILENISLSSDSEVILVGRDITHYINLQLQDISIVETVEVDFKDIDESKVIIDEIFSSRDIDLAIFAYAILPAEDAQTATDIVEDVFQINSLSQAVLLNRVAHLMRLQKHGQILYISTVASLRPRKRNFVYGASKTTVDFLARGLQRVCAVDNVHLTILRPGFVKTKMTNGLSPAPFPTTRSQVAKLSTRALKKKAKIVYSPRYLRGVMGIIRILPERVFSLIDK